MRFLYFDCFSGISGDMLIAALLDMGASFPELCGAIDSLNISARLQQSPRVVQGIRSTAFAVSCAEAPLRHLADIELLVKAGALPDAIKVRSLQVFTRLAEAEASVHGISPEEVHFHEIGAVDTVVDIVGTFVCLSSLGIDTCYVSPLPWSGGLTAMSHGRYPLPAPATSQLLLGSPCVFTEADMELVTPTGAALITSIASPLPDKYSFVPDKIAYGAGSHVRKDGVPNLLRVMRAAGEAPAATLQEVAILESELDDLNPEVYTHLFELFLGNPDVLDFFTTAIFMKKNRPGILITIIAQPTAVAQLAHLLMQESGTLGVRYRLQNRLTLHRSERLLATPWGQVRLKTACLPGDQTRYKPEFEDCRQIARDHQLPLVDVMTAIIRLVGDIHE